MYVSLSIASKVRDVLKALPRSLASDTTVIAGWPNQVFLLNSNAILFNVRCKLCSPSMPSNGLNACANTVH